MSKDDKRNSNVRFLSPRKMRLKFYKLKDSMIQYLPSSNSLLFKFRFNNGSNFPKSIQKISVISKIYFLSVMYTRSMVLPKPTLPHKIFFNMQTKTPKIFNLLPQGNVSSEPSKQWLRPSQIKSFDMQCCRSVHGKSKHDSTPIQKN